VFAARASDATMPDVKVGDWVVYRGRLTVQSLVDAEGTVVARVTVVEDGTATLAITGKIRLLDTDGMAFRGGDVSLAGIMGESEKVPVEVLLMSVDDWLKRMEDDETVEVLELDKGLPLMWDTLSFKYISRTVRGKWERRRERESGEVVVEVWEDVQTRMFPLARILRVKMDGMWVYAHPGRESSRWSVMLEMTRIHYGRADDPIPEDDGDAPPQSDAGAKVNEQD